MVEQFGIWPIDGGLYAQDPDFIDELRLARLARNDHDLFSADSKDNKNLRRAQSRRRVELMKWRNGK